MPFAQLDRSRLKIKLLECRPNKVAIERDCIRPGSPLPLLTPQAAEAVELAADRIRAANRGGRPVMLAFGAHTVKNGLAPVIQALLEGGWVQHLATNGAGIIHDWEFAFQGESSEDVRTNVAAGQFGIWEETGLHLNLALLLGAHDGLGYGESVGRLIHTQQHVVPDRAELLATIGQAGKSVAHTQQAAAAADLLGRMDQFGLASGTMHVPHQWQEFSLQATAYKANIPFTAHPMFGHDIIYTHPMNCGAAIGRTAERDFLTFAEGVAKLSGGVYLSVGSAVMSPMVFEKSMAMAQNLAIQAGTRIEGHTLIVVDLAPSTWDWSQGEPPMDSPDYYLRYCKTFNRMGGDMHYASADNRDFLPALLVRLQS